ncbi:MBL fold metallo-hydrolase [Halobaculum gomorrense]|uniref:MBL fold metallo-hydrolase n=1 Tax=Halobaculum gomorrense TaxID=43928 RepID=UPI00373FDEA6
MPADTVASVRLVRHATLLVTLGETTLIVDPMLGDAGVDPPVQNTPNQWRNPLVDLPDVDLAHDAVLVTYRHTDHFDAAAARDRIDPETPMIVHPEQVAFLEEEGFTDVRPLSGDLAVGGLTISPTPARQGYGDLADAMAPVTGAVVRGGDDSPAVYLAGDTVWYDAVAETLSAVRPDAVVVHAGAARFLEGDPITMDAAGVREVRESAPNDSPVIAVHMDAINHCLLMRDDLREAVSGVTAPEDGEVVTID